MRNKATSKRSSAKTSTKKAAAKAPASKRKAKTRAVESAPRQAKQTEVKITAAKGRPMLTWVGKRPLSRIAAFPAQHIETFDPTGALSRQPAS